MSSPDRVFETARDSCVIEEECAKPAKKKRPGGKKAHGIEKYSTFFHKWTPWKWYKTEKSRDQAYNDLIKSECSVLKDAGTPRYRKVDR